MGAVREALRPWRWTRAWERWYRRALPAYWVFLFACTHAPLPRVGDIPGGDKTLHVLAFAVLAFFYWRFAESFGRPVRGRVFWIALPLLMAYAALDELLQGPFGRYPDWRDWVANCVGICGVLFVLEFFRRRGIRVRKRGSGR